MLYAINPTKTAWEGKKTEEADMSANIAYALNPAKGTTRLYQTAVNLDSPETAWKEMKATKERWGKTGGISGFHAVQSFKPGEIEPELAHRVGVEFVERCFPGFEAMVGTHLDKHHIHNHIILNSVSCLDGHKYHTTITNFGRYRMNCAKNTVCRWLSPTQRARKVSRTPNGRLNGMDNRHSAAPSGRTWTMPLPIA